jgi:hypothetical protein
MEQKRSEMDLEPQETHALQLSGERLRRAQAEVRAAQAELQVQQIAWQGLLASLGQKYGASPTVRVELNPEAGKAVRIEQGPSPGQA